MMDKMIAELKKQQKEEVEKHDACNKDKAENKEYQQVVADQRATVAILTKALDRLKDFYAPKMLLQRSARIQKHQQVQAPPSAGKDYEKNAASGGVMSTIEMIIQDAEAADAEAVKAEQESQAAYAELVANTNAELTDAANSVTQKSEEKAKTDANRLTAEKDLTATLKVLEDLHGING